MSSSHQNDDTIIICYKNKTFGVLNSGIDTSPIHQYDTKEDIVIVIAEDIKQQL